MTRLQNHKNSDTEQKLKATKPRMTLQQFNKCVYVYVCNNVKVIEISRCQTNILLIRTEGNYKRLQNIARQDLHLSSELFILFILNISSHNGRYCTYRLTTSESDYSEQCIVERYSLNFYENYRVLQIANKELTMTLLVPKEIKRNPFRICLLFCI